MSEKAKWFLLFCCTPWGLVLGWSAGSWFARWAFGAQFEGVWRPDLAWIATFVWAVALACAWLIGDAYRALCGGRHDCSVGRRG
jgi:hypothetical protein